MGDIDKHIQRIEAILEEMQDHPDCIFNNAYVLFVLHDWPTLANMTAEQKSGLSDAIAARCLEILCPPLAVCAEGSDIYFLVHLNPERSLDNIAHSIAPTVTKHAPSTQPWTGEYSAASLGVDELESLIAGIECGGARLQAEIADLLGKE